MVIYLRISSGYFKVCPPSCSFPIFTHSLTSIENCTGGGSFHLRTSWLNTFCFSSFCFLPRYPYKEWPLVSHINLRLCVHGFLHFPDLMLAVFLSYKISLSSLYCLSDLLPDFSLTGLRAGMNFQTCLTPSSLAFTAYPVVKGNNALHRLHIVYLFLLGFFP